MARPSVVLATDPADKRLAWIFGPFDDTEAAYAFLRWAEDKGEYPFNMGLDVSVRAVIRSTKVDIPVEPFTIDWGT